MKSSMKILSILLLLLAASTGWCKAEEQGGGGESLVEHVRHPRKAIYKSYRDLNVSEGRETPV
jgi:hypothetical protein